MPSLTTRSWLVSRARLKRTTDAPFRPYAEWLGVRQSWRLFVAPQRYPVRVEVSIREGDTWTLVYQSRSDEHTWRAGQLNRYRLRRAMFQTSWERERAAFKTFCDWIADQAARDFPDAEEVMIRQLRYRTPAPAEARAGETILEPTYLSRETRHILNAKTLALLPRGAYVVNTARGGCIDLNALYDALESGHIAYAGLDVVEREPLDDERIRKHPRVILTPHTAFYSVEGFDEMRVITASKWADELWEIAEETDASSANPARQDVPKFLFFFVRSRTFTHLAGFQTLLARSRVIACVSAFTFLFSFAS